MQSLCLWSIWSSPFQEDYETINTRYIHEVIVNYFQFISSEFQNNFGAVFFPLFRFFPKEKVYSNLFWTVLYITRFIINPGTIFYQRCHKMLCIFLVKVMHETIQMHLPALLWQCWICDMTVKFLWLMHCEVLCKLVKLIFIINYFQFFPQNFRTILVQFSFLCLGFFPEEKVYSEVHFHCEVNCTMQNDNPYLPPRVVPMTDALWRFMQAFFQSTVKLIFIMNYFLLLSSEY